MERGPLQRTVHLHDQGERLPAARTHRPRRRHGGQGVLKAQGGVQNPAEPRAAPRRPSPAPALTGTPPSLLAVQAPGPVGWPRTSASRRPSSTGLRTAAMTTGTHVRKEDYGGREGPGRRTRTTPPRGRESADAAGSQGRA